MAALVALVGDLHCNSTVALCPPSINLDDGGTYRYSKQQRWIWARWLAFWQTVAERREGRRLVVILNGELADDNRHATTQLVSRNPADYTRLSLACLEPVMKLLQVDDRLYVLRGTEAHSGASGSIDEMIARDLGAVGPDDNTASHFNLRINVDGVRLDVAHHPPGGGGRLPWTRGNFANRLAGMAVFDAAERGDKAPHLYVRGHVHRPEDSYDRFATRALVLPSWQLQTAYGHRIGGAPLPIGGAIVTCDNGRHDVEKHYWHWPIEGYEIV